MSFIAEYKVDTPKTLLGDAITEFDDALFEVNYSVSTPTSEGMLAFISINGVSNKTRLETLIDGDELVDSWQRVYMRQNKGLYEIESNQVQCLYTKAAQEGVAVDRCWCPSDKWHIRYYLPSRSKLSSLNDMFKEITVNVTLEHMQARIPESSSTEPTQSQCELVREAYERGYFQVPRGVTQSQLAEKYGVTSSTVSQKLRRGLQQVLTEQFNSQSSDTDFR